MNPEIYHRKKNGKRNKHREIKQHAPKNLSAIEEHKEEIRKYVKTNENGNTTFQHL